MAVKIFLFKITILILVSAVVIADDWPQWRGPERNGCSKESGLLKKWPESGPGLIWSYNELGSGFSSAAIAEDEIYITGEINNQEAVFSFDLDGNLRWKSEYGNMWKGSYPAIRSTPTVNGNNIYIVSGMGKVVCMDRLKGEIVWSVDAVDKFGADYHSWGIAESPLIVGDKVICTPGAEDTPLIALNKYTGELIWQSNGIRDGANYCSPILVSRGGKEIIVTMLADNFAGLDASNGKVLWKDSYSGYQNKPKDINPVSPFYHNGEIYTTSGYDDGGAMYQLSTDGSSVTRKWTDELLDVHHGGVVLHKGYIYGANWLNNKNGNWVCLEWNTGKLMYEESWSNKGSIIYADDMLYCYTEKGDMGLVPATPAGFKPVSVFEVSMGSGQHWAHPAISDGRLYIRHGEALMVFDIKGK